MFTDISASDNDGSDRNDYHSFYRDKFCLHMEDTSLILSTIIIVLNDIDSDLT